jgi:hypothetical protein
VLDTDEWADSALDTDDDPIPGLGELPDCDDDQADCDIVEPGEGD